jgi:uncharacterized membrane protein YphA (DoxX/SURF4 family)
MRPIVGPLRARHLNRFETSPVQDGAMRRAVDSTGFQPPSQHALGEERGRVALAELAASIALVAATVAAVTVLSVGIARAEVADGVIGNEGGLFGVALLLGLLFFGMGGLSLLSRKSRYR